MCHQFKTLAELAEDLRQAFLSVDTFKTFVSAARCASYPDLALFNRSREAIKRSWPSYVNEPALSRPPAWALFAPAIHKTGFMSTLDSDWLQDGLDWQNKYSVRLQDTLMRMNHHIHPLKANGKDRRPLSSCTSKAKPNSCKGDFPLNT